MAISNFQVGLTATRIWLSSIEVDAHAVKLLSSVGNNNGFVVAGIELEARNEVHANHL